MAGGSIKKLKSGAGPLLGRAHRAVRDLTLTLFTAKGLTTISLASGDPVTSSW